MPKLALFTLAALALALALFLSGVFDPEPSPGTRVDAADVAGPRTALEPPTREISEIAAVESRRVSTPTPPAAASPEGAEDVTPACVVVGRFVDEDGQPLPGVRVQLGSWKVWSAGSRATPFSTFRGLETEGMVGFQLRTDAEGAFRFDVPVPTGSGASLYAAGDRFHDSYAERFGFADSRSRPPLTSGLRDLGTLSLASTGALIGRVTDSNGVPIEGAQVGIGPTRSTTYGRNATTGADGRFTVQHAPVGTYGIKAKADGYLSVFREPITVEAGRDAGPFDLMLERAPTISGRVVDTAGAPLMNVRVGGWPLSSGSGAWTKSLADGTFTVSLPQEEPYTLEATHGDYATWGDENDHETVFEPGTTGLEITLESAQKTRFVVKSAANEAPLERFGLRIYADEGTASERHGYTERRRPKPAEHPGGVLEIKAREGLDRVLVWADGHLLTEMDVTHDEGDPGTQTVTLEVGATITGRVLDDGAPVVGAPVEVSGLRRASGFADPKTIRHGTTDADGRFRIDGLGSGLRRLGVQPPGAAEIVRDGLLTQAPEVLDVGDLEVVEGGTIAGVCLLPAGVDPVGLTVYLDGSRKGVSTTTDSGGRFRFEDVSVGSHEVSSDERPGVLEGGASTEARVQSGATADVTLDLTDRLLFPVEVEVVYGDLPLDGAHVSLRTVPTEATEDAPFGRQESASLGRLDENGVARGSARALGPCHVEVYSPLLAGVRVPDTVVDLDGSGPVRVRIELALASATIVLPPGATWPNEGTFRIRNDPPDRDVSAVQLLEFSIEAGRIVAPGVVTQEGSRVTVHGLVPGSRRLTLQASPKDAPNVPIDLGNGWTTYAPEALWRSGAEAELAASGTTLVTLE